MKKLILILFLVTPFVCNAQSKVTAKENQGEKDNVWVYSSGTISTIYSFDEGVLEFEYNNLYFLIKKNVIGKRSECELLIANQNGAEIQLNMSEVNDLCRALKQLKKLPQMPKPEKVDKVEHIFILNKGILIDFDKDSKWRIWFTEYPGKGASVKEDLTPLITKLEGIITKMNDLCKS